MTPTRREVENLMKRCMYGVRGGYIDTETHSIMAECYWTLGALMFRVEELEGGIFSREKLREITTRGVNEI